MMRVLYIFVLLNFTLLLNASAEEKVLRIQVYKPDISHMYKNFIDHFVNPINRDLKGELRIEAYPQDDGVRLVTNKDAFSAVKHGRIDGMFTAPLYWGHIDPVFSIVGDLVAAWSTPEDYVDWFDNYGGESYIQNAYKKHGMHMIGYTQRPTESLASKTKLENLDDIKGKVIRVPSGGMSKLYFEKLGANPREISMELVVKSLAEGKIQIADFSTLGINHDEGLYLYAPHTNYIGFHSAPILDVVVSEDNWNALSQRARNVIKEHARRWNIYNIKSMKELNENLIPVLKAEGVKVYEWDDAEIKKARVLAVEVWDEYAKRSPEAKAAVESVKAWHEKYGGFIQ